MFTTLNFWLWAAQIVLAGLFGMAGFMKATRPLAELAPRMGGWVNDFSVAMVRFIGIAEIAAALGMILPMLTGILPWLTPLAAVGLAIIQVLAIIVHARRNELMRALPFNLVLLALSAFVAWGRWDLF